MTSTEKGRQVELRDAVANNGTRTHLWAWVDEDGLHVDGQDLGLPSGMMGSDSEYEYFHTVHAADVPS